MEKERTPCQRFRADKTVSTPFFGVVVTHRFEKQRKLDFASTPVRELKMGRRLGLEMMVAF